MCSGLPIFLRRAEHFHHPWRIHACYSNSSCCPPFVEGRRESGLSKTLDALPLRQNRVHPGFKVLLSFGPQFAPFHGERPLDGFHPLD